MESGTATGVLVMVSVAFAVPVPSALSYNKMVASAFGKSVFGVLTGKIPICVRPTVEGNVASSHSADAGLFVVVYQPRPPVARLVNAPTPLGDEDVQVAVGAMFTPKSSIM